MRKTSRLVLLTAGVLSALPMAWCADDKPAPLTEQKDKYSYALGVNFGNYLKRFLPDANLDLVQAAMKDILSGREPRLSEAEMKDTMMALNKEMAARRMEENKKMDEERRKQAEINRKAGDAFLAQNRTKDGVKTHPVTLQDGTTAELQYKILKEGSGDPPKSNDTVTVNYRGTLIEGKEFDNSANRPQPSEFQVTRVIRGWTEALLMMKPGAKWQLFIPSSLAYGDYKSGAVIEPGSTLLFDVELLSVKETPAPPTANQQPLTSDIIRVPSADEIKKGAQIEVIKPEDVEKRIKAEQAAQGKDKPKN